MSDDITDFIRASREICDKATPGPWYVHTSCREVFDTTGHTTDKTYGTIAAWYPHTFTTREGKSGWDTCGGTTGCGPSRVDAWFCAHARTALPRALDMLEAQQRETEKWRDARDELARARRWDIDKLERQMDVVAEQLVVALRDGDALRKQLAEQQAEIARLRKCPSCTDGTMMFNIGYFPDGGEIMGRDVCAECEGTMVGAHARKDKP